MFRKSRSVSRIVPRTPAKRSHTCCDTLGCNPSTPRAANWMKHPSLLYGLYPLSSRFAIPDLYAFSISRLCSPRFFIVLSALPQFLFLPSCRSLSLFLCACFEALIRSPFSFCHSVCNAACSLPIKPSGYKFN